MLKEAKIFLADQRGCSLDTEYRALHTFNYRTYFSEHRMPFGKLQFLNDTTLASGASKTLFFDKEMMILIVPIVGAIQLICPTHGLVSVDVGECFYLHGWPGAMFELVNPYASELINFLVIGIDSDHDVKSSKFFFDLDKRQNDLHKFQLADDIQVRLGKFQGRSEGLIDFLGCHFVFAFVIEGAFEVESRLLQARDGLALPTSKKVEFEALSNEAVLLVISF